MKDTDHRAEGSISAVCFDAFGTTVEIVDVRRPYRKLARLLGTKPLGDPLTEPIPLRQWAARFEDAEALAALEDDLAAECASIRFRSPILDPWHWLRAQGVRIGICSNLALPYGPPMERVLPDAPDDVVLSYDVGLAKPDPRIYDLVAERLGLAPAEILFVGDTPRNDVEGPVNAGMSAMSVADFEAEWSQGTLFRRLR